MKVGAVIAVRGGPEGKSRLAGRLRAAERVELVRAMLEDMLEALGRAPDVARLLVVTPTQQLADIASAHGADIMLEPAAAGVNAAFAAGRRRLAAESGLGVIAMLPADLALISASDVKAAADLAASGCVVISPAWSDGGTGALFQPAALDSPLRFGRDSFRRHSEAAAASGTPLVSLRLPGLCFDVDHPSDIDDLAACQGSGRAVALARAMVGPRGAAA